MMVSEADNLREWIFVLDEDQSVGDILQASGMHVRCFVRAAECLAQLRHRRCDLLITDLQKRKTNVLRLLEQVKRLTPWVPVLIVTGSGDIPTAVTAIKHGAVDFIEKPFREVDFIEEVKLILRQNHGVTPDAPKALTPKEFRVLKLIVEGKSNREIAKETHRHKKTVEAHRARLMRKLGVRNVIELLKLAGAMRLVILPFVGGADQARTANEWTFTDIRGHVEG